MKVAITPCGHMVKLTFRLHRLFMSSYPLYFYLRRSTQVYKWHFLFSSSSSSSGQRVLLLLYGNRSHIRWFGKKVRIINQVSCLFTISCLFIYLQQTIYRLQILKFLKVEMLGMKLGIVIEISCLLTFSCLFTFLKYAAQRFLTQSASSKDVKN